ncbi:hypothetical protein EIN_457360 [Entamoeba invadens IP1]|uniref:Uncharacterized protein n=1 Tax=Entamoeba invadens IP1 TaxID=370355 RepID=A0A0A1U8U2_ENTIV|nr:hypothetical protein EIN_457360 [Entamoeba invadens IP1]ELP89517.1 hypothetical protein EIN_457360 [Entamoeba invadens IP1]|eukprot:XP_004256288.1 hypothetical protein EIN_457360 [Entamoeba invadens IP1]
MSELKKVIIKLCVCGDKKTGKTSLVRSFMDLPFSDEVVSFDDRFVQQNILYNSNNFELSYYDLVEDESSLNASYWNHARVLICVISLDNLDIINNSKNWFSYGDRYIPRMYLRYVVGTKSDLQERVYSYEECVTQVTNLNATYFEVSNKTGFGIKELKDQIILDLYNYVYPRGEFDHECVKKKSKKGCQMV